MVIIRISVDYEQGMNAETQTRSVFNGNIYIYISMTQDESTIGGLTWRQSRLRQSGKNVTRSAARQSENVTGSAARQSDCI